MKICFYLLFESESESESDDLIMKVKWIGQFVFQIDKKDSQIYTIEKKKNAKCDNLQVIDYSQIILLNNRAKNLHGRCSKKVIAGN